jgi:hypothetical protein
MEPKTANENAGCSRSLLCDDRPTGSDLFFEEKGDLLSEILSFLDIRSQLAMCNTTKKAIACLRYEHVFASTRKKTTSKTDDPLTRTMDRNAIIILNKLASVYDINGERTSGSGSSYRGLSATTTTIPRWTKTATPSPLRLLRLVNGRRCERCHSDLVSPCVWAGTSGFGQMVLPSLSFGEFCCTRCIFDPARQSLQSFSSPSTRHRTRSSAPNALSTKLAVDEECL